MSSKKENQLIVMLLLTETISIIGLLSGKETNNSVLYEINQL